MLPCCICKRHALYGYGVNLLKKITGRWYCREHRPAATK
jgi:hypothetical protein